MYAKNLLKTVQCSYNLNLIFAMDIEADNYRLLKQHQRRIVNKAFRQSEINRDFVFPLNDSICTFSSEKYSLQSDVTEIYNLFEQNSTVRLEDQQLNKDQSKQPQSINWPSYRQKSQNNLGSSTEQNRKKLLFAASLNNKSKVFRKIDSNTSLTKVSSTAKSAAKRTFLSLTPQKSKTTTRNSSVEQEASTRKPKVKINLTQRRCKISDSSLQKQSVSFLENIKTKVDKCWCQNPQENRVKNEAVFHDSTTKQIEQSLLKQKLENGGNSHSQFSTGPINSKTIIFSDIRSFVH